MKSKNNKIVLNIIAIFLFVIVIVLVGVKYSKQIILLTSSPSKFKDWVLSFGNFGVLVFILFQILQVIVSVIPGEAVQVSGGYIYGTLAGTLYSLTGIMIGSVIVFYLARLLGYNLIKKVVSEKSLEKFYFVINSPKIEALIFLLFLIPGIPKDVLVYIAGLSPIKPINFFIITAIARFPGIFFSSYFGSNLEKKNYGVAITVAVVAIVLFIIGFVYHEKILEKISSLVHKKR
ncbi:TVP38/TMEM64 family protein [Anaerocellum danielii]|uniref:TVP38/TMEM64 family membrane protein n=1 Tax=Anaerocellum danielii TaxID=1387557 RepID=A0ABZ0U1U5_9FIRM|nr:TVP38/TMEM64 family protein [Caldicellulosiruptor danielii]WPX09640.1 TVP38/TMEM64 family protein [Caldicellulosiruptor danielii]